MPLECLSKGCPFVDLAAPSRGSQAVNTVLGGFHVTWGSTRGTSSTRALVGWLKTRGRFRFSLLILGTRWHSGLEVLNFIVVFSCRRIENPVVYQVKRLRPPLDS